MILQRWNRLEPAPKPEVICVRRIDVADFVGEVGEPGRIRTFDQLIKSQLLYH